MTGLQYSRLTSGTCARILVLEGMNRRCSARLRCDLRSNDKWHRADHPDVCLGQLTRVVLNLRFGMPREKAGVVGLRAGWPEARFLRAPDWHLMRFGGAPTWQEFDRAANAPRGSQFGSGVAAWPDPADTPRRCISLRD